MDERQKKPTRKRPSEEVEYLVTRALDGRRWTVTRGDQPTGGFARDKSIAVGLALREAAQEMAATRHRISVWSVKDGKRTNEWPG